jgi:hypothetical protein
LEKKCGSFIAIGKLLWSDGVMVMVCLEASFEKAKYI